MKEYKCVQVDHHDKVGKTISQYQEEGWRLHTYQTTGEMYAVAHYLLFEKG